MLTLTRNPGEGLRFGDKGEIEMYVLDVSRGQIKLGFKAPASTPIKRKEVYNKPSKKRRARKHKASSKQAHTSSNTDSA